MTTAPDNSDLSPRRDVLARIALWTAAVAGVFVAVVLGLMVWDYAQRLAKDPLDSDDFRQLKKQVAADPENRSLKEQVQAEDLALRQAYFGQRRLASGGALLLLGGTAVLLVSLRAAVTLRRRLPSPELQPVVCDRETPATATARRAVGGLAAVLLIAVIGLGLGIRSGLENGTGTSGTRSQSPFPQSTLPDDWPTNEEIAKNWPYFRGPGGLGISPYENVPTTWDVAKGENILWKTKVPLESPSSPIVWNDRLFLTGATQTVRQVYCFDANSGQLLWQKDLPPTPPAAGKMPELSTDIGASYACPTPATDGRRVYAWFASGDVAAFDFSGEMVWCRSLGIPNNTYGHAASPTVWHNLLILQFDQATAKEKLSKIMALDSRTGNTVWETPPVPASWSTPIVISSAGQEQIIAAGTPWLIAYQPQDGQEIWRADCLRGTELVPSPVFAGGLVYAVSEEMGVSAMRSDGKGDVTGESKPRRTEESAVRPSGKGDVTASHLAWTSDENKPDVCSPLATPEYVFWLTSGGTVTCYDAAKGKKLWEHALEVECQASLSMAGKYLYVPGSSTKREEQKVFVLEPGPTGCKRIAAPLLGERCLATPAFQDGRMYIRGKDHLFCIGKK